MRSLLLMIPMLAVAADAPPRVWNDKDLADWATPIAALNVRPGHFTEREYYAARSDNYRTYPLYHPAREPKGYWDWLRKQKPAPIVDRSRIKTDADWIRAGRQAFLTLDDPFFRTNDPATIATARDPKNFQNVHVTRQGYVVDRVWVVTDEGLMLSSTSCLGCHVRVETNGNFTAAGPGSPFPPGIDDIGPKGSLILELLFKRLFPGDSFAESQVRTFQTPWDPDPRVESLRNMTPDQLNPLIAGELGTTFARFNGSPWHMTKIPDLHNLRYQRYIDATATHRLRGPLDIARYAALVTGADSMDFGPHRMLTDQQRRVPFRYADEVLFAIGQYLWSLTPPANPKPPPAAQVREGEALFAREGCNNCHAGPGYTSGKLTLAQGWKPPADHPEREHILPISVGTEPGLALKTRKGTGFYKIPSLRGLWYRPRLLHDGSVATLEEMFDPKRLSADHVPGGWKPPGTKTHAIIGHPFGLGLNPADKSALIAFLRTI